MSELYGTEPIYYLEIEVVPGEWRRCVGTSCSKAYGLGWIDAYASITGPRPGARLVRQPYPGSSATVIAGVLARRVTP